jgi:hypothetical protein
MSTVPTEAPRARSKGFFSTMLEEATLPLKGPLDLRHAMIAEAAYYLAERRGFKPGHELEDWLAAEAMIDRAWQHATSAC